MFGRNRLMKEPREHDNGYLDAIRKLPCTVCGIWIGTEAAHIRMTSAEWEIKTGVRTGAGGGEKPHDRWAVPLCVSHHRTGNYAEHVIGTIAFWKRHELDPHAIADALYRAYPNEKKMWGVIMRVRVGLIGRVIT